jgi:hypothetical protein
VAAKHYIQQFLDSAPKPDQFTFDNKDFRAFDPRSLPPIFPSPKEDDIKDHSALGEIDMEKPIPPSEYLENGNKTIYVWGVVRYKDFTGEWTSFKFCRGVLADKIFKAGREWEKATVAILQRIVIPARINPIQIRPDGAARYPPNTPHVPTKVSSRTERVGAPRTHQRTWAKRSEGSAFAFRKHSSAFAGQSIGTAIVLHGTIITHPSLTLIS